MGVQRKRAEQSSAHEYFLCFCRKKSADLLSGGLIDQGHFYIAIASAVIERERDAVPGGKLVLDAVQLVD